MARLGPGALRRSEVARVFALVVVDIFALYEAFTLAYIRRASASKPLAHYVSTTGFCLRVIAIAPLWVLVFAGCGLYSARLNDRRTSEVTRVGFAVAGGVMTLIVLEYLSPSSPLFPSRAIPVWAVIYGVPLVLVCRFLVRRAMKVCFARGLGLHNVVLIGTGPIAAQIATEMSRPGQGYRIVAVVDAEHDGAQLSAGPPVFSTLESAIAASSRTVDEIMQADANLDRRLIARMIAHANAAGISYRFVPDQYGVYAAASSLSTVGGVPVLELRLTALDGWGAFGKRCFDIVGSLVLIAMLSVVFFVVAIAVKVLDPSGPVFYRHNRLGKNGRPIGVLKFRSMDWQYSTGPDRPYKTQQEAFVAMGRPDLFEEFALNHKVLNDPRVSRLGGFLRRTSLDELPQLFNSAVGDLSLVGPRPITGEELTRYGERTSSFLALKPGITGLWQVSGRSDITYGERVQLDVFYLENWSVALDVSILLRTLKTVTARRGSY